MISTKLRLKSNMTLLLFFDFYVKFVFFLSITNAQQHHCIHIIFHLMDQGFIFFMKQLRGKN